MENRNTDYQNIKGWGVDANPDNEPTAPMRTRYEGDQNGYNWKRPFQQPLSVEVLQTNERPFLTSVFGTSTPPSGLSGMIRRFAFRYSESSYAHWLPLLLADRINVYEGIFDDLKRGHIPNFFAERGWKAEWKYNRKNLIQNIAIGVAATTVVVVFASAKNKNKKKKSVVL